VWQELQEVRQEVWQGLREVWQGLREVWQELWQEVRQELRVEHRLQKPDLCSNWGFEERFVLELLPKLLWK
jgi:hypothetical protein